MNYCQCFLEHIIRVGSPGIILLVSFVSFLNQTEEPRPAIFSNSQAASAPSSAASTESPLSKKSCEIAPTKCTPICQTALSAESRAAELNKSWKKAREKADKAVQKAASIEEKINRKIQKMSSSKDSSTSGSASSQSKVFWKLVALVPRLFVSNEANARARREDKEAEKYGAIPSPDYSSQDVAKLRKKSEMASKSAEESQKAAADAKMEADQAHAYADNMRQSYKSCLSGVIISGKNP